MIDLNKPIYDVYLVTFKKNTELNINTPEHYCLDSNFKNAILTNNLEILKRILVQPTTNNDEFREIITDKDFRSCIVYTTALNNLLNLKSFSNNLIEDYVLIKPIYYNYKTKYPSYRSKAYEAKFIKATKERLDSYLYDYQNKEEYSKELDSILQSAKNNYFEMLNAKKYTLKKHNRGNINENTK